MPRKKKHQDSARSRRESGEPGGGAGRTDDNVGGSGVYPASGGNAPEDAVIRDQGEWGQKLGGQVGGQSEFNPLDMGLSREDLEKLEKERETEQEKEEE